MTTNEKLDKLENYHIIKQNGFWKVYNMDKSIEYSQKNLESFDDFIERVYNNIDNQEQE